MKRNIAGAETPRDVSCDISRDLFLFLLRNKATVREEILEAATRDKSGNWEAF